MKLFTCTDHACHWNVGSASVVVARSEFDARLLLIEALKEHGLTQDEPLELVEVPLDRPQAIVLCDGDY